MPDKNLNYSVTFFGHVLVPSNRHFHFIVVNRLFANNQNEFCQNILLHLRCNTNFNAVHVAGGSEMYKKWPEMQIRR